MSSLEYLKSNNLDNIDYLAHFLNRKIKDYLLYEKNSGKISEKDYNDQIYKVQKNGRHSYFAIYKYLQFLKIQGHIKN